ncbi:MAG: hypothetical protein CR994_05050 [Maribacter sp.]|nr:MAG: hypothetical protein CR994_05050 [Maribacter sp.]
MKKYVLLVVSAFLTLSCNSQEKKNKDSSQDGDKARIAEAPKGSWKVNREFDEDGNLIRYDSIYSWSSGTDLDKMATMDRDSILSSMQSRFYNGFSNFDDEGFPELFSNDSLFAKQFFNDDFFDSDFGQDFMEIDRVREQMENMQRRFLERYRSEFDKKRDGGSGDGL